MLERIHQEIEIRKGRRPESTAQARQERAQERKRKIAEELASPPPKKPRLPIWQDAERLDYLIQFGSSEELRYERDQIAPLLNGIDEGDQRPMLNAYLKLNDRYNELLAHPMPD